MQANLRLDESGAPAAPPAPPVPTATRPAVEVKKEDAGVRARAEYEYEVRITSAVRSKMLTLVYRSLGC
jgi:hypothetical protein